MVRLAETVSDSVFHLLALAAAERTLEMTKDSEYPRVQEARRDTATGSRCTTWMRPWTRGSGATRSAGAPRRRAKTSLKSIMPPEKPTVDSGRPWERRYDHSRDSLDRNAAYTVAAYLA